MINLETNEYHQLTFEDDTSTKTSITVIGVTGGQAEEIADRIKDLFAPVGVTPAVISVVRVFQGDEQVFPTE